MTPPQDKTRRTSRNGSLHLTGLHARDKTQRSRTDEGAISNCPHRNVNRIAHRQPTSV